MRGFLLTFFAAILSFIFYTGCNEEKKVDISANLDPSKMPTMMTRNIMTFISDSGITQYKIVTPLWLVYDEIDTPCWRFPEGIYLQKFDKQFKVISTVAADSAIFYKEKRLWKLEGNVEMTKVPDELFLSPRLYWNQRTQRLSSDTFMHVENTTHVLEGSGFDADEQLKSYRVLHPTGVFPVNQDHLRGGG